MVSPVFALALGDIAVAILAALALLHLFWASGGKTGKTLAVPEKAHKAGPAIRPSALATLAVAAALAVAAVLVAMRIGLLAAPIPQWFPQLACTVLALVFLARAIGEFRYVGFFKRVRDSRFARLDTALYSPLCLFMAIAIGVNAW